jgi:hypothetical protein
MNVFSFMINFYENDFGLSQGLRLYQVIVTKEEMEQGINIVM